MARALSPQELTRYPWASQITDYVPVGRLRKLAVGCTAVGLVFLVIGTIVSLAMATNIHHALALKHPVLAIGVFGGIVLAGIGILLGVVTGVQAVVKGFRSLLLWSAAAIVPALVMIVAIYMVTR
ncbi:MAG TPA: hypothetical protein VK576_00090 [Thermoleophilia bacterium]|nr:hypothetical protein [Thermoleophilia bacterium]